MKRITSLFLLLALFIPTIARTDGFAPFTDLDTYINNGKVAYIGECLPLVESNLTFFGATRQVRIINVLRGTYSPGREVKVIATTPLIPGNYYLLCGEEDTKGELGTRAFELGEVEIHVWGEAKAQKEYQLNEFIKQLEGKTLKEKIQIIFKKRQDQLKEEEQKNEREMELLGKALKP